MSSKPFLIFSFLKVFYLNNIYFCNICFCTFIQIIPEKDIETITSTSASTSPEAIGKQHQKPRGLTRRKANAKEPAQHGCKETKNVPAIKSETLC